MDTFLGSSFGMFIKQLFQGLFTARSWRIFALLACGWALATGRQTITTCLWLTGAATVEHCSRLSVFLGGPGYEAHQRVWACIIRHATHLVSPDAPRVSECDDTTKKEAGPHIEGVDRYRNGAGSAPHQYRTLRGLKVVLGVHGNRAVVVSHGITKEQRVPPREIERAIERKNRFTTNPTRYTFRPELS